MYVYIYIYTYVYTHTFLTYGVQRRTEQTTPTQNRMHSTSRAGCSTCMPNSIQHVVEILSGMGGYVHHDFRPLKPVWPPRKARKESD